MANLAFCLLSVLTQYRSLAFINVFTFITACKFFEFKQLGGDIKKLAGEKDFERQILFYIKICLVRLVIIYGLSKVVANIVATGKEIEVGHKRLIYAFESVIEKKQRACRAVGELMHIHEFNKKLFGSGVSVSEKVVESSSKHKGSGEVESPYMKQQTVKVESSKGIKQP